MTDMDVRFLWVLQRNYYGFRFPWEQRARILKLASRHWNKNEKGFAVMDNNFTDR